MGKTITDERLEDMLNETLKPVIRRDDKLFYKLVVHTPEEVPTVSNVYSTSDIPTDSICLLATYVEKETLDVLKIAIRVKSKSMLGRNYKHYSEEEVNVLYPKPSNDKSYRIVHVEEINDVMLVGY